MSYNFIGEYDLRSLDKIYLTEFTSGHGGDYFISLYGLSNNNFLKILYTFDHVVDRLDDLKSSMPGNNIGSKLIRPEHVTADLIKLDLDNLLARDPDQLPHVKYLQLASHPQYIATDRTAQDIINNVNREPGTPIGHDHDLRVYSFAYSFFDREYKNIVLLPTTVESVMFILHYEYKYKSMPNYISFNEFAKEFTDNIINAYTESNLSLLSLYNPETFEVIDHIDITLSTPDMLLPLAIKLTDDDIDIVAFEYIKDYYVKRKLTAFTRWMEEKFLEFPESKKIIEDKLYSNSYQELLKKVNPITALTVNNRCKV